jgi:N-methylhydantoinase A
MPALACDLDAMCQTAAQWFDGERITPAARALRASLDFRYRGQSFELNIALPNDPASGLPRLLPADELRQQFMDAHERGYGYYSADDPVEVVNLRLTAIGRLISRQQDVAVPLVAAAATPAGTREVWFDARAATRTQVYQRETLQRGAALTGPAVIEQFDSTVLLHPGDRATVDRYGNIQIELSP